ncbi:MAG: hypothetical protein HQL08_01060 [Nitrospirae bacterium]|nr:hypothetical protein [Nitrospirota bacterium]
MAHNICIKTKGNHKQGMGDVMGSIAIAEEFRTRGLLSSFIVDNDAEALSAVQRAGFYAKAVSHNFEASAWDAGYFDIVIVNQLNTPSEQLSVIKKHCSHLVTIDDTGEASRRFADLRINPLYYDEGAYNDVEYIPLHPVFQRAHAGSGKIRAGIGHVLVTLGGSDTYGLTPQILDALSGCPPEIEIAAIIGPAFKHDRELDAVLSVTGRKFDALLRSVDIETMCKWIQWADLAICAAGNTLFEMACCGTPAVVVCGEPFEEETAYRLEKMGFGKVVPFNTRLDISRLQAFINEFSDSAVRERHSQTGKRLIDGMGIMRIVDKALGLINQTDGARVG